MCLTNHRNKHTLFLLATRPDTDLAGRCLAISLASLTFQVADHSDSLITCIVVYKALALLKKSFSDDIARQDI